LKLARNAIAAGQYENALTSLERVEPGKVTRPEIKQDVEFYDAYCRAKLALAGGGDVRAAGRTLANFVSAQPGSYHHLEARMLLGDLLVAVSAFPKAEEQYAKVAEAPWPETRLRAQIARGRTLLAQEKYADAQTAFEAVLTEAGSVEGAEGLSLRLGGELGKAECLAGNGQFDEAIKMAEKVIAESQPEDVALNGRAYVTLGNCYRRKPNATKDALLAYLHVDVLYFRNGEAHAESLARLSELWSSVGKPERALEAKQMLSERYPNSRWAQQ
jgi:tetratricopeptide (TPR) repeat protein